MGYKINNQEYQLKETEFAFQKKGFQMGYKINNQEYQLKERYTLKEWGEILKLLSVNAQPQDAIIQLLVEDKIKQLLNLILDKQVDGELYEEDIEEISRAIQDFFSRKTSLIKNTQISSSNSTEKSNKQSKNLKV